MVALGIDPSDNRLPQHGACALHAGSQFWLSIRLVVYALATDHALCLPRYMQMLQHCQTKFSISFNFYDQSSKCHGMGDSSVSYAAATVVPAKATAEL